MTHHDAKTVLIGRETFVSPSSYICGDVTLGEQCTIMHHVVIRGDVGRVTIGDRVNVQDGVVVHTNSGDPLTIGDDVAIGHRAVVHGSRVGHRSLIGIGAILLDASVVGDECIVAAGAVVVPGTSIPDRTLVMGLPAKAIRRVTDEELGYVKRVVRTYIDLGRRYSAGDFPNAAGVAAADPP